MKKTSVYLPICLPRSHALATHGRRPWKQVSVLWGLFVYLSITPIASAQSPTLSASPTVTQESIDAVRESLIKANLPENVDRAKKILDAKQRRALIGKIKDITSSAITIQLKSGATKMAAINEQTVIIRNGKTAKPNEMAIGDFIIAMGYASDSFTAKRVIAQATEPKSRDAKIIFGKVSKINPDKNTLSITTNRPAELGGAEVIGLSAAKTVVDLIKLNLEDKVIVITVPGKTGLQQVVKAVKLVK